MVSEENGIIFFEIFHVYSFGKGGAHTCLCTKAAILIKVYKIHEFERYASVCSIFSDAIYASKLAQVLWNFLYDLPVNLEHVIC